MRLGNLLLTAIWSFLLLAVVPPLAAGDKRGLERITPVPPGEQIPVLDFFRPRLMQQPILNPSGTHVAAIVTAAEDKHALLVYELKTNKIETVGASGDRDLFAVNWLNDRRLVFELSAEKQYSVGLFAAEVGSIRHGYALLQYYGSHLISVPTKSRLRPLVWNRFDGLNGDLQRDAGVAVVNTDLNTGSVVNLLAAATDMGDVMEVREHNDRHIVSSYPVPPGGFTAEYLTDKEGALEFCITVENGRVALQHLARDHWEPCHVNLDEIDVIDCGDEPGQLVVRGPRQEGKPRALQYMDGVSGKLGEVLIQDTAYDFYGTGISDGRLYRHPVHHHVIGALSTRNGPNAVWFNEEYRVLQKILNGFFPGLVVRILGSDEAQKLFLVATYSDRQPVIYNWVDLEKRAVGLIKNSAPWIDPKRMQPQSILKFKTRDGRQLDAYITLPAGTSQKNPPPLVVLPHGGPWARDSWGFDGEAQFLASRGYAVLQPNYRGSNGYSWMFPQQDNWDFVKMHDDVTDATKTVISSGFVDRERIAIMGTSFGGYLAVAGAVREPSLYRCAITIAGVFDWAQHIREKKFDRYESYVFGYFMRRLGDPQKEREKFDAISPGRHVDQIRIPVFVSGGKDDSTVNIAQSRALVSALEKYHVPHETYIVRDEGHGMQHLDKQVELYTRIEAFLAKNLALAKPAAAAALP